MHHVSSSPCYQSYTHVAIQRTRCTIWSGLLAQEGQLLLLVQEKAAKPTDAWAGKAGKVAGGIGGPDCHIDCQNRTFALTPGYY